MRQLILLLIPAALACASRGTRPLDTSAIRHQEMAAREDAAAARHRAKYDPDARREMRGICPPYHTGPCYQQGTMTNPTAWHLKAAERHETIAIAHDQPASRLLTEEAEACEGLPEMDRPLGSVFGWGVIDRVEALTEGKGRTFRRVGARIVFRATPPMTAEWLERLARCHRAHAAVHAFSDPELGQCPLSVRNATITVPPAGGGYSLEIRSGDLEVANDILARACAGSGRCNLTATRVWQPVVTP